MYKKIVLFGIFLLLLAAIFSSGCITEENKDDE